MSFCFNNLIKLSDAFTSTQIDAMVDRGLIPRGDVYDGSAIFKYQQELTNQELIEKHLLILMEQNIMKKQNF